MIKCSFTPKMKSVLISLALCQFVALVLSGTLPEVIHPDPCLHEDHNDDVTNACLKVLDKYDTIAELRAEKTACQIHEDVEQCVKEKGGICKSQGKELYGVSGIFEKACQNPEDEETLWKFFSEVLTAGADAEHQLEHDFSQCLEESTLNFFDFAKLLFSDESEEDDFELDPSKLLEGIYVCGLSSVAKTFNLNLLSLDRLAKGFLEYSGLESVEKLEVCKTKLALPTQLCADADKCLKNDDHNDDVALKCFDEFDRDVTDYSVFKGKENSKDLYNKIHDCIELHGGFCHEQSDLGPALLNVFKYVSEHEEDGNVWWDLLTKFEHVSDEDERKFENTFVHCLNESNTHFLNPQHLSLQSFEQLEDYIEALYVCIVASVADTFHANYNSVGRLSNAFVEKLGFEVDEVKFCGHPLSLPTALCAAA